MNTNFIMTKNIALITLLVLSLSRVVAQNSEIIYQPETVTKLTTQPIARNIDKSDDVNIVNDNSTVVAVTGCEIKVYNAVTPDGSDESNKLLIQGLECYSDSSIEIFNRWGVLVFEKEHYNNDDNVFRGLSEGRITIEKSQELPSGTYFYLLRYKDSQSNAFEKSGYLYLNRR